MTGLDPHFAALTAPGAPFEIGEKAACASSCARRAILMR